MGQVIAFIVENIGFRLRSAAITLPSQKMALNGEQFVAFWLYFRRYEILSCSMAEIPAKHLEDTTDRHV